MQGHTNLFFILVGNKTDQPGQREVSKEEALSFATQHDMEYYETSAMNGSNIEEVFHKLAEEILSLVDDGSIQIKEGWRGVKRGHSHHNLQGPLTLVDQDRRQWKFC